MKTKRIAFDVSIYWPTLTQQLERMAYLQLYNTLHVTSFRPVYRISHLIKQSIGEELEEFFEE